MSKKISEYGFGLLDELDKDRSDFRADKIDVDKARTIATLANSTSRAMGETLRARRDEVRIAMAAA